MKDWMSLFKHCKCSMAAIATLKWKPEKVSWESHQQQPSSSQQMFKLQDEGPSEVFLHQNFYSLLLFDFQSLLLRNCAIQVTQLLPYMSSVIRAHPPWAIHCYITNNHSLHYMPMSVFTHLCLSVRLWIWNALIGSCSHLGPQVIAMSWEVLKKLIHETIFHACTSVNIHASMKVKFLASCFFVGR